MFPLLLSMTWILECSNADRHRPLTLNAVAIQHFGSILCDLLYQSGFTLTAVILYSKCVFLFNRIFGHTAAHQIFVFCFFFQLKFSIYAQTPERTGLCLSILRGVFFIFRLHSNQGQTRRESLLSHASWYVHVDVKLILRL